MLRGGGGLMGYTLGDLLLVVGSRPERMLHSGRASALTIIRNLPLQVISTQDAIKKASGVSKWLRALTRNLFQ